jgi:hypothetical protein
VTKHLLVMADAGLARGRRQGRERLWELFPEPLDEARRCLAMISESWDEGLARLKQFVEEDQGGTGGTADTEGTA